MKRNTVGNKAKSVKNKIKIINKKEDKKVQYKTNINKEITDQEYNEIKRKCFFFLRRYKSQNNIMHNKISYKTLNFKKKKIYNNIKNFSDNFENSFSKKYKKKEEEKIIYDNMQPRSIWLNCKRIYNKYKKDYNSLIKKNKSNNSLNEYSKIEINKKEVVSDRNDYESSLSNPLSQPENTRTNKRTKSVTNNTKVERIIKKSNYFSSNNNNIVKKKNNFINRGINYIINRRKFPDLKNLKNNNKTDEEIFHFIEKKKLPFLYPHKKLSSFINTSVLEAFNKEDNKSLFEVNTFFEIGSDNNNENEIENNLKNISKDNNKSSNKEIFSSKKEKSENYKENQSVFNFISLKSLFKLKDFHIFGVINGKGKEPHIFSRLLKKVIIKKFSDERNYMTAHGIKYRPKNFKLNYDFIYYVLTLGGFIFIKKIFNSLINELKKIGADTKESGATLFLIIIIKDKIISIKVGDMYSFFIYESSEDNHLISKNPHLEHLVSNLLEQDRLEDRCEFNKVKDEIGNIEYEIITGNEEIQKCINKDNIKFTRIVGYSKLEEIGFICEPDIQVLFYNRLPDNNKNGDSESSYSKKTEKNINAHASNSLYKLKYIIIGNKELFEYLKIRLYTKEINEAFLRDKRNKKINENIKYCFNLKKVVKKLVNDSIEMHKKYMRKDKCKERCMALITLT
jgi:hypothetical protein